MTRPIANSQTRQLSSSDYDLIMSILQEEVESPTTPDSVLRWNSCLRNVRDKLKYHFGRAG